MAEPIRRRIIEIVASGEHLSGDIEAVIVHEFGVGRSAVQHHLRVLRANNCVDVRFEEAMRGYNLNAALLTRLESEVRRLRRMWRRRLGWSGGTDPLLPAPSRRGRRGRGADPDDMWLR